MQNTRKLLGFEETEKQGREGETKVSTARNVILTTPSIRRSLIEPATLYRL